MIVQPLLSKISVSFMIEEDLYDSTIITIPRHLTLDNYQTASLPQLLDYGKAFKNTFFELKKVTWPSKRDLLTYSLITIGFMVCMGIIIYLIDLGSGALVNLLLSIG